MNAQKGQDSRIPVGTRHDRLMHIERRARYAFASDNQSHRSKACGFSRTTNLTIQRPSRCLSRGRLPSNSAYPARITLARHRNKAGIDDLTRHGRGQLFSGQPDRAGVWNTVLQPQSQEPHKQRPVIDEKFGASSERMLAAWMTRILNISTRSNGGRLPSVRSV